MNVYLLDCNERMVDEWKRAFSGLPKFRTWRFEVVLGDFASFMDDNPQIDAVVSPANSFGFLDGGYDLAIRNYFGERLQRTLQNQIANYWFGELPVGVADGVYLDSTEFCPNGRYLIAVPTMTVPEPVLDPRVVYGCARSALVEAKRLRLGDVLLPAFGAGIGNVEPEIVADLMALACRQVAEADETNAPITVGGARGTARSLFEILERRFERIDE